MNWKQVAFELWRIIDDIDTAGDMAKESDEAYRALVEADQKKRWKILDDAQVTRLYEEMGVNP